MPNKIEELKNARHPLDAYPDLLRYAAMGPEGWRAITDDDKERLKWFGVFFRKPTPGHFMMRVRVPGGIATSAQLRELAAITRDYGRDVIDLTTRQQVQLRWMTIADVPDIIARLEWVGLTSRQTGMDNSRNVVGCPLAGLTVHELFDATPAVLRYHELLLSDREYASLPRKFNVSITGCLENCCNTETQDIGLTPAVRDAADGPGAPGAPGAPAGKQVGFNVRVGGKMGSGGMVAGTPLDAFVPLEEAGDLCAQITLLFARHGAREARARARMYFLVQEWGIEKFRAVLEEQIGRGLPRAGQDARLPHRTDHLGLTQQKAAGTYAVGLCVPVGRTNAAQLDEVARLAERYGSGEARLTIEQNVLLVNVPDRALPDLLAEPLLRELRPDPTPVERGTVSCIGVDYCNLALAETKGAARALVRHLDAALAPNGDDRLLRLRPVTLNWSGCPAACGNHQASDIGFLGGKSRIGGEVVETFDVFVGGRTGTSPRAGEKVLEKVPSTELPVVAEALVRAHARGESLRTAAQRLAAARAAAPPAGDGVPNGRAISPAATVREPVAVWAGPRRRGPV
jgi:ferredoxin-nitrite reductase